MIDLHTHSIFSDGSFTPEELAVEARMAKLSAVALTDHDSVGGVDRFLTACKEHGIRGVPGVEISVDHGTSSMHMLGYLIDHHNRDLEKHLAKIGSARVCRNEMMLERLLKMGLALSMREVSDYAGGDNIGRLHFAQALVARGYVKTRQEAFERFLARGKPGYADRSRLSPAQGIDMIREAGGLAVLAHPFTLALGKQALTALVNDLVQSGLDGIEVYYPQQTPKQMKYIRAIATKFKLEITGGTDFHGAAMPEIQIGRGFGSLNVPDTVLEKLDERRRS
ncbi:PHP domain-containing protein [Verrucomicrobiota bacterium]